MVTIAPPCVMRRRASRAVAMSEYELMSLAWAKPSRVGLDEVALQVVRRGPGDAVHEAVEDRHLLLELVDGVFDRRVAGHVQLDHGRAAEFVGELLHAPLQPFGLIRERDGAAVALDRLGDGPGDRARVGGARHQEALAVEQAGHPVMVPPRPG